MAEKKKSKLGAKAIFARILAVILVTAIGGVASFFGYQEPEGRSVSSRGIQPQTKKRKRAVSKKHRS